MEGVLQVRWPINLPPISRCATFTSLVIIQETHPFLGSFTPLNFGSSGKYVMVSA